MLINDFINSQNKWLWDYLSLKYKIELIYEPKETSWRIDIMNSSIKKVFSPSKNVDIPSFTHELLHLYLHDLGMSTTKELMHSMYGKKSFKVLTKNGLFSVIHNFCSHKKMYPYYTQMGFCSEDFVSKHARISVVSFYDIKFRLFIHSLSGVTDYIGNVMSFYNNMGENYMAYNQSHLNKLRKISPSLFEIIKRLNEKWESSNGLDLATPFQEFDLDLDNWLHENKYYDFII